MTILGIDWGEAKIGLAIATAAVAEPYAVIRFRTIEEVFENVAKVVQVEQVEKVVVAVSEGRSGEEAKDFSLGLRKKLTIPVETFDETLSTQEAQKLAIEAGIKRKKRKDLDDTFAAALVLQSYLDSHA